MLNVSVVSITSFSELEKISEKLVEASQTGELSASLDLDLAVITVEEPEPEPVDPLGGKKATKDSGKSCIPLSLLTFL